MDYSAVSTEADALHGSSPWGSSSPRADRGFPTPTAESPESPAPVRGHSYNQSQDSIPESPYLSQPSNSIQGQGAEVSQPQQGSGSSEQGQEAQQDAQAPGNIQRNAGQPQQRPGTAARYHNTKQQRPVPQYKLQAKVTALERIGRKDPVIRFDVYVSEPIPLPWAHMLTAAADKSAQVPHNPVSRCSSNSFRVCQARGPFNLVKPRSTCACRASCHHISWCRDR